VIDLSSGPEVPFPVPDGQVDEVLRPLVVVQRHRTSSLQLAVRLGLGLSEVAAHSLVDFVGEDVPLAVRSDLVGTRSGTVLETLLGLFNRIA